MLLALAFEPQIRDFSQDMEKMFLLSVAAAAISLDLGVVRFVRVASYYSTMQAFIPSLLWSNPPGSHSQTEHVPASHGGPSPTNILQFPSSVLTLVFAEMDPQGLSTLFKFKSLTQLMVLLPSEGDGKLLLSLLWLY